MTHTHAVYIPTPSALNRASIIDGKTRYDGPARLVKSLTLEFLKIIFGNQPRGSFHWDNDLESSDIIILDSLTFNLPVIEKRPAIVVKRGAISPMKVSGIGQLQEHDIKTGDKIKTDLMQGTITLQCYGKGHSLQAEILADMVFEIFDNSFEDALRLYGFKNIYATGIGEEMPVRTDSKIETVMVPVGLKYQIQRRKIIQQVCARKVNDIVLEALNL